MIFLILLTINILFIALIKTDKKYWLASIPLFVSLLLTFMGWRIVSDNNIKVQESKYWKSAGTKNYGDHGEWTKLESLRKKGRQTNAVFIEVLVLQAFLTFVLQIIGRIKTDVRNYRWTSWAFGILFFIVLWLRLMMSIVPYGIVT